MLIRRTLLLLSIFVLAGFWHGSAPTAAVTCTFTTGTCVGTGGGSSLFTAATCNGIADDAASFASFNSWAVGTWQASHSGQIKLSWSGNCTIQSATVICSFNSNLKCPFINIKNLLVDGNGGQWTITTNQLISVSGIGVHQDNTHSARTVSANKGDTCVSLITAGQVSLFPVGYPVLMTGFDLQSIWGTPQGFPPNPQFWDHLHVASVDAAKQCDGTTSGASVRFTTPLTFQYLSTWPNYNGGSSFEIDPGGPATLYVEDPSWDSIVEFDNLTINYANQIYAKGDTVIYKNVTFSNGCAVPTEGRLWQATNGSNFTACGTVEFDKITDSVVTNGIVANIIQVQSSSPKSWTDTGSTISQLQGSPLSFVGSGTTFTSIMKPGVVAYGRSDSFSCTNCSVASFQPGGVDDSGLGHGVQNTYTMTSGTIKIPNGTRFNSVQNNGGKAQLVVDSSAGFTTGKYTQLGGGSSIYSGVWQLTVDDATHMTLTGSTFSATDAGWACSAGGVGAGNCGPTWAAPGTNIMFLGTNGIEAIGQVTAVTQDANFTYVATTGVGSSFPADVTDIGTHPSPKFNCSGCTGADTQIASLKNAPADAPLFSYQTYTYAGSIGTTVQPRFIQWGALSQLEINVTAQSTGASQFHLSQFDNWPVYVSGSGSSYGPTIAAGTAGDRKVSASGTVTCNGSAGACSGSDSLTTPSGLWFGGQSNSGPQFASAPSAGASVTVTLQTNQGVVNP